MKSPWIFRLGGFAVSHRLRWFRHFHVYTDEVNDELREDWLAVGFLRIRRGYQRRHPDAHERF